MKSKAGNFIRIPFSEMDMEEQIWEYIDGSCHADDAAKIAQLIKTDPAWTARYNELLEMHTFISASMEPEHTSMRFTQNLMEHIEHEKIIPATKSYVNKKVIWAIASCFILLAGFSFFYTLQEITWTSGSSLILPEVQLKNSWTNKQAVFFGTSVIVVIMMLSAYDLFIRKKHSLGTK